MEKIKQEFASAFVEALSKNSAEDLYPLCNNFQDMKKYGAELDFTEEKLGEIVLSNCSKFLETIDFDITEYNLESSALNAPGESVEIVKGHSVIFANSFNFLFSKKEGNTKLKIKVGYPIIIDDQVKINNPQLIEFNKYEPYVKPQSIEVTDRQNQSYELPLCKSDTIKSFLKERSVYIEGCAVDIDWYIHDGDLELDSLNLQNSTVITGDLSVREPLANIEGCALMVLGKTTVNALSIMDDGVDVFLLGGTNFNIGLFVQSSGPQIVLRDLSGPIVKIYSETTNIEGDIQVKYYSNPELGESRGDKHALIKEKYLYEEDGIFEVDSYAIIQDIKIGAEIFNDSNEKENYIDVIEPDLQDRETIISLLKEDGLNLKNLDEKFKSDKELIETALKRNPKAFEYIAESLKEDRAYVYELVNNNGRILEFVNDSFKKDKELVMSAISSSAYALDDAHESLKSDKEVVLLAVSKNARVLEYADESLQADEDVLLAVINNDVNGFKYAPESAADNRNIMLTLVKKEPKYLSAPPLEKYLTDKEFLVEVLTENHTVFNYLPNHLQDNKEFREIAGRK